MKTHSSDLFDPKVNIKIRLACFWSSLMFLYIYADFFGLMTPKALENMIDLKTPVGPTTPGLLVIFSVLLIIPALMILFSVVLRPKLNKWLNIGVALFYAVLSILIIVSDISHEWQTFFVLYQFVELFVFGLIIVNAWKWPKAAQTE